jgi:catechol 2,3-dioxygenase-like lactoylglutathione lyase family enzyme
MASGIDHIVIAVSDPDAAAAQLAEALGLAFTAGGRHPGLGTFNRLAFLGDAYLELIGVEDGPLASSNPIGAAAVRALERGGGFATYALLDDAIKASVARLQANGSSIGAARHGSRDRPDGERVEWWTAAPPALGPDRPPFLIRHQYAGSEWGADALAARRTFVHPIGSAVRLLGLEIALPDPLGLAADCRTTLGLEFLAVGHVSACAVGRQAVRLLPSAGGHARSTLTIGAAVEATRLVELLGMRFEVRPATLG